MKLNKLKSVKVKVFLYMAAFALVMLVLLWLFQTVFLGDFYQAIKTDQIKTKGDDVSRVIKSDDFNKSDIADYVDQVTSDSDYCVTIYDGTGYKVYQNSDNKGTCGFLISEPEKINELYRKAYESKNQSIVEENDQDDLQSETLTQDPNGELTYQKKRVPSDFKSLTYGKIVRNKDGDIYFVMINAKITLVGEVVNTLRQQLLIITGILIILAMLIAVFVSRKISKPISETNKGAKELAKGNLKVEFKGKGYLEIEELNDTLNYASKQLAKVENLRNELIANVSHDFRTPLTMIAGYSELIRDLPNENTPENIQVIIDECNRLTRLVNDLLDLSKLQTNNQEIHYESVPITDLCKDVCNRFNVMLKKEGYLVEFNYDQDLMITGDELRLSQVLYNIIGNAIHYTGADKKVVVNQIDLGDSARFEIKDSGKGIKPEELEYVWDRYYKAQKVTKRQEMGTGIGLSICKGILELHQAKYGVESEVRKGTTFFFELKK